MAPATDSPIPISQRVATLALDTFTSLPQKCKPRRMPDGSQEWTPMSAIVLSRLTRTDSTAPSHATPAAPELKIVSLATGTKSLSVSALSKCNGLVLHDCHAEILALRGLNRWLLCEIERMFTSSSEGCESSWLEFVGLDGSSEPFRLRPGVGISLFSTEAPCGDASMELLMAAAEAEGKDVRPWPTDPVDGTGAAASHKISGLPLGRGFFSNLGALRRKPARADAEISMSKSCTDKLMLKQVLSVLSFPLDVLLQKTEEAFLRRIVVYEDQYDEVGYQRAFSKDGRLRIVLPAVEETLGQSQRFFQTELLPMEFRRFEYEKRRGGRDGPRSKVTNISAVWTAGGDEGQVDALEVIVNGVKQGYQQFSVKEGKGSVLCRRKMMQKFIETNKLLRFGVAEVFDVDFDGLVTYSELKSMSSRVERLILKGLVLDGLGGWPMKPVEDDFEVVIAATSGLQQIDAHAPTYPTYVLLLLWWFPSSLLARHALLVVVVMLCPIVVSKRFPQRVSSHP